MAPRRPTKGPACGYPAEHSGRPRAAGLHGRLLAARGLVGLGTGLLRMVQRAYRAGYLDLAQVEYCLRLSAKLRGCACCLIGTKARDAPALGPLAEPRRSSPALV